MAVYSYSSKQTLRRQHLFHFSKSFAINGMVLALDAAIGKT
jgi:hypothetical protein